MTVYEQKTTYAKLNCLKSSETRAIGLMSRVLANGPGD